MSAKRWVMDVINNAVLAIRGTTVKDALKPASVMIPPAAVTAENTQEYDPDAETAALLNPVPNPIIQFHEALRLGTKTPKENPFKGATVSEAYVFEGHFNEHGKLLRDKRKLEAMKSKWPAPYLIRHVRGHEAYRALVEKSKAVWEALPGKAEAGRVKESLRRTLWKKAKETKLVEQDPFDFGFDGFPGQSFDPNQYTEFTPLYGGPFFKQLYLTDYLRMHALAFEAWNHNPLAKRIIELLAQYSFGRRFKVRIKDAKKQKAWDDFEARFNIRESASQFWVREYCIYGEIMLNTETWQLIDPSTVWDIITDPDNLKDVYYYYQSYPTAYQMFTGYSVPGEPGSAQAKPQEYILRQIPANKVYHIRGNCVSNEKRGRSVLFPILGWLKRVKDLYNAIVIRQWLMSCFIWDDTIKGSAADVTAHANTYSTMPKVASTFAHNESVVRKPMPAIDTAGGRGTAAGIGEEIISFIATAIGIPKEFLNVMTSGGGSRAQALTSAEPFTKVIEDIQAKFESVLIEIAEYAIREAGLQYDDGDVEFIFPSVTKDTTTETVTNIATGETMGYISKQTAAEMYAGEMNITNYKFEDEQNKIGSEQEKGLNKMGATPMPPKGRFGGGMNGDDEPVRDSPIHGNGKVDLTHKLKSL